ncbi:MAG TPA: ECF transporter S component [Lachnospiraceae bacterium]|nr:ECF transporter S component [Lachnospiraceae bacterium]
MNNLMQSVTENFIFVLEFLGIVVLMFAAAYGAEKLAKKKSGDTERILSTRKIAVIGVFSAIAFILMLLEFPVPFAPPFYELDFSEIPVLIGTFAFGPVAGVMIEFCKILLKLVFKGTTTAFVGDLANFVIGCSFVLPAAIIYLNKKTKKMAIAGSAAGTLCMTVFGTAFNAVYLLPKFAQLYGMPLDAIIAMGTAINPAINSVATLVVFAVAPLNILKGGSVSLVTMLVYKKLSPILKEGHRTLPIGKAAENEI